MPWGEGISFIYTFLCNCFSRFFLAHTQFCRFFILFYFFIYFFLYFFIFFGDGLTLLQGIQSKARWPGLFANKCLHFLKDGVYVDSPIGWGCGICQLRLCRGIRPPSNKRSEYDAKLHLMVLQLGKMWSTLSLLLLPVPLWFGMVLTLGSHLWVKYNSSTI